MLNHTTAGPRQDGMYLVVYPTPGCNVPTVACECSSQAAAIREADRLNAEQIDREVAAGVEQQLRELRRIASDLGYRG
jgi:hypothetical protein